MSETPSNAGGEPSVHMWSVEIIPLYRIQAELAVQRKWIGAADVPRAENLFTEWRSRGRRIDLAEAIAEVASMSQGDLEELRKLALVESLKVAPPAGGAPAATAAVAAAKTPASPASGRLRQIAIGAAILAVGLAVGFLLRTKGGDEGGASDLPEVAGGDGGTTEGDSGKGADDSLPDPRTGPSRTDPPKQDPPRQDPPKEDPPKADPPEEEPPPTPPAPADSKGLQEWLFALSDRQLARLVGTPTLDETIGRILSEGDPVEVDRFLAKFNDRLRQVQDLQRGPK